MSLKKTKKTAKKSPKSTKGTVIVKVPVDAKTFDFYKRLGKLCEVTPETACLVIIMAEALRKDDLRTAQGK